jgi:predicted glycosyltransferase
MVMDYEHAQTPPLVRPRWEIVPEVLLQESLHCKTRERILTYPGIKEDVYAPEFRADPALLTELELDPREIIASVRPPATEAHYHNPESEALFVQFMNRLCATPGTRAVLLPRNKTQEAQIRASAPQWFAEGKVIIPRRAVDGLNLLWHSDLVVSGGGTMNREAAALGIPVYSIFRGKAGAVDRQLQSEGRLTLIENGEQVNSKILLKSRTRDAANSTGPGKALPQLIEHIEAILKQECAGASRLEIVPSPTQS